MSGQSEPTLPAEAENTGKLVFLPTLVSSLLPLVGISVLDWELAEVAAIYWLDIGIAFVVYGIAALFAKQAITLEERGIYLPGVGRNVERREKWNREPNGIELPGSLPPIYPRNVRLIQMSLVWGLGMLGVAALALPNILDHVLSIPLLLTTVSMVLSRLYGVSREFFGEHRYEHYSVHAVLEVPARLLVFAACYVSFVVAVGGGTLLFIWGIMYEIGADIPDIDLELAFGVALVTGKVAVEWFRFRAENESDPTGFAAWFRPENRTPERQATDSEHQRENRSASDPTDTDGDGWRSSVDSADLLVSVTVVLLMLGAIVNGETVIALLFAIPLIRVLR